MPPQARCWVGADPAGKVTPIDHGCSRRPHAASHGPVDAGTHYKGIQLGLIEGGEGGSRSGNGAGRRYHWLSSSSTSARPRHRARVQLLATPDSVTATPFSGRLGITGVVDKPALGRTLCTCPAIPTLSCWNKPTNTTED